MNVFYASITLLLFVTLLGVLVLWGHAPSAADRLLAASLSGALSLCLLLLLARAWDNPLLDDVVLGLTVLGSVGVSSMTLRAQSAEKRNPPTLEKRLP
ncbi:MAG: monovalent cation/H+ antiporter complex subunit F [Cystobacter sp.]